MPIVELIPLGKGNHINLDDTVTTTIGRTLHTGCMDNRISRNHAQLFIKSDGTLWIKSIHDNPTFYKTKANQIVTLKKDKEYQLHDNDQFGLLPDEYFYQVSIKSHDQELEKPLESDPIIDSTTIPKSPIQLNEVLATEDDDEKKMESKTSSNSSKTRALPIWISNSSISASKRDKEQDKDATDTAASAKKQIYSERQKTKEITYENDESTAVASTEKTSISNDVDSSTDNQTSSTAATSTKREQCVFGESCYRKNATHRQQASHPGDLDWNNEENDKNKAKPECPYGHECYRKNLEHLNQYHHSKRSSIEIKDKRSTRKRKTSQVDDDDDGLPNEYDYNDSFIDDETTGGSSCASDKEESSESPGDIEWKPSKDPRYTSNTDDDSSDESDFDLTKQESAEFTKGSTTKTRDSAMKKSRLEDDD
ncbi:unnamed protein product [Rotaria socialis]|uniref:Aprataxin and PNK-like factor n=1 Tax=Rotaria socialis TaxID=392032 RepID=A0A820UKF6_9BILA|nr:unnamed protein product [Rotaria socialis]CAF4487128.1 unnamed protein product [Rotaria socialis]